MVPGAVRSDAEEPGVQNAEWNMSAFQPGDCRASASDFQKPPTPALVSQLGFNPWIPDAHKFKDASRHLLANPTYKRH